MSTAAALAWVLLGSPDKSSAALARTVTFRADDGVTLTATLYESTRRPAPAVILLHMLTRSRADWDGLAHRLGDAGFHALAIDFRGHGASSHGEPAPNGSTDFARMLLDAQAARAFLAARSDVVRPDAIGIVGASIGANIAILQAADDQTIRSLALLSPSMDYRSLRVDAAMRKYGARPAYLVAATNDPYALRSMKTLLGLGDGIREGRTLDAAGHGTTMLGRDPTLAGALVDWFQRTLL